MRVERFNMFGNSHIDIFDDGDNHVGRAVYRRQGDSAHVSHMAVFTQVQRQGWGQLLVDNIRMDLGDIGDPDLDYAITEDGKFTCGGVTATLSGEGLVFLPIAMAETKRRRDNED